LNAVKLTSETLVHPETAPAAQTALGEAQVRFDRAADRLRLDPGTHHLLRSPMREHRVAVTVRMDDDWSADEVLQKLDAWMTEAVRAVHQRTEREQVSLRDAAYLIATDRVARACRERGWV
jgi:glutamate dehydrogenase/leucine dehydrogenase